MVKDEEGEEVCQTEAPKVPALLGRGYRESPPAAAFASVEGSSIGITSGCPARDGPKHAEKTSAQESSSERGDTAPEAVGGDRPRSPLVVALLHVKWANFLQRAGKHAKAAEHFRSSLAQFPNPRAHFGLGTCLACLRRRQEAIESFREALRISPGMVGAHVNLAGTLLALRRFDEAETHCRHALRLEPHSREAVMNLANALRNLGRREEAVALVWEHIAAAEQVADETPVVSPGPAACANVGADGFGAEFTECQAEPTATSVAESIDNGPVDGDVVDFAKTATRSDESFVAGTIREYQDKQKPYSELLQQESQPQQQQWSRPAVRCASWQPAASTPAGVLAVVCIKWGKRYDATYVNRLFFGVRRHLASPFDFICFTDDATGFHEAVEARPLPEGLPLWWGKAHLFSEEAGLDGRRVLLLDLDQVVVDELSELAGYSGPFAVLSTDDIACEQADGGFNSSVLAWDASPFFRAVRARLTPEALRYVHRFDHWLEMNVADADTWQLIAPGRIVDYTTAFLGGVCIGSAPEGKASLGAFADEHDNVDPTTAAVAKLATETDAKLEPPAGAAIVTFPRNPKPHEVLQAHSWVRQHWKDDAVGTSWEAGKTTAATVIVTSVKETPVGASSMGTVDGTSSTTQGDVDAVSPQVESPQN
eukprot:TRINITY_DN54827_c0_g1_i1.p1 TRINITY_DN54827_c0_g1~~TRINITY_DN54827_c0_g1_i1.p1  ORF type:complete len:653 (+),score=140.23 TRINITY_DN54827_c0_g1_i1:228-2186(+)